jgi:uncharacterized membrane protein
MNEVEFLQKERKSFIIGSLLVLGVCFVAVLIMLSLIVGPHLRSAPELHSLADYKRWQKQVTDYLQASPQWGILLIRYAGALGLFFLSWRFSALIRRPHAVFAKPGFSWPRLGWWLLLFLASMMFLQLIPELLVIAVLAHWGTDEIRRRSAHSGPNAPDSNS